MGHLLGYARVSNGEQDAALQLDALKTASCYRIFTDTASGSLESRPELARVLDQLRPGDTLVVWRLKGSAASMPRSSLSTTAASASVGREHPLRTRK